MRNRYLTSCILGLCLLFLSTQIVQAQLIAQPDASLISTEMEPAAVPADDLSGQQPASALAPISLKRKNGLGDVTRYGTALFTTSFNFEDVYLGFQGSYPILPFLAAMVSFDFRPSAMRVLVEEPGGVYYQYRERRYLPALGLEFRINISDNFQAFASARGGFLFGDYRGMTTKRPEEGFVVVPNVGIAWITQIFTMRASYEYQDVKNPNIFPHRVNIGLGFMFGRD